MKDEKGIMDNYKVFGLRNWVVCDAIYFTEMRKFEEEAVYAMRPGLRATWPTSSGRVPFL